MSEFQYRLGYYGIIVCVFGTGLILGLYKKSKLTTLVGFLTAVAISLFVGMRPIDVGEDTIQYSYWFNGNKNLSFDGLMEYMSLGGEPLFRMLLTLVGQFGTFSSMLCVVALLTNLTYFVACKRISDEGTIGYGGLLGYLFVLSSFTCWSQEINVIRSGLGISFFVLYTYWLYKGNKVKSVVYGLVAVTFHFSTLIFILLSLVVKFLPKVQIKWYYWAYVVALVLSVLGFSVLNLGFLQGLDFEKAKMYTSMHHTSYVVGFRPLFALYNTAFLVAFIYLNDKKDALGEYLLKLFILSSCAFFMWFALPYSDRIGAYSWILIPILLCRMLSDRCRGKNKPYVYLSLLGYISISWII